MYQIQGQLVFEKDGLRRSVGVPTFFLAIDFQGIVSAGQALEIARKTVDAGEQAEEIHLTAYNSRNGNYETMSWRNK